jgi:hypothetical protein
MSVKITPAEDAASPGNARELARRIRRMALIVRNAAQPLMAARPAPAKQGTQGALQGPGRGEWQGPDAKQRQGEASGHNWWVLAQGRKLDPEDFEAREAAREDLLYAVLQAGVLVGENVWVWDDTGRAQLVLATLPTLERARRVAERLKAKGLSVAVRPEMPSAE